MKPVSLSLSSKKPMNFQLPTYVLTVLEQLNTCGFEAYAVGGCVRDMLLGHTPYDFDVCTNATPQEMLACFCEFRTVPTGIEHGTVTVIVQNQPVEVTTYRIDGEYADSRHPDAVSFTSSLKEDLARRDFTVNAMAYHPQRGLVDLYGGREDLNRGVIRCVGDPMLRFSEDALRILRGLRFASSLGFSLEPSLVAAMETLCSTLQKVAMERVFVEFTKLLCGKGATEILQEYAPILSPLFCLEQQNISLLSKVPVTPVFRYAALLRNHPDVKVFLKNLKASNELIAQVEPLVFLQTQRPPNTLFETRKWVFRYGVDCVEKMPVLFQANDIDSTLFEEYVSMIQQQNLCCSLKDLAVNGKDLLALGIPKGEGLGAMLNTLLFSVMEGTLENRKEDLLAFAKAL